MTPIHIAPGGDQMSDPVEITTLQNEYLLQLDVSPKTTNDLMRLFMVSMPAAGKIVAKIRTKGLVVSASIPGVRGSRLHTLVKPYGEYNLLIRNRTGNGKASEITEEEILYAAILRNAGMTGQELTKQFKKVFPNRAKHTTVKHIVALARKTLCR